MSRFEPDAPSAWCLALLAAAGCVRIPGMGSTGGGAGFAPAGAGAGLTDASADAAGTPARGLYATAEQAAQDLGSLPALSGRGPAPRILLDAETLTTDGIARIHRPLLAERLRVHLNRAARGRLLFVGRAAPSLPPPDRPPPREGAAPAKPEGAPAAAPPDFRLDGRVTTQVEIHKETGTTSRSSRIAFTLVDLKTGQGLWEGTYELR